jgi:uncharacterized membrane protein YsdA (DUF1294 family)
MNGTRQFPINLPGAIIFCIFYTLDINIADVTICFSIRCTDGQIFISNILNAGTIRGRKLSYMSSIILIASYIAIVNFAGFAAMGIDKHKAKAGSYRIPESTLFILALIGGSIGSITGMFFFRHKTRHWYFLVFMPLILILQMVAIGILCYYVEFSFM